MHVLSMSSGLSAVVHRCRCNMSKSHTIPTYNCFGHDTFPGTCVSLANPFAAPVSDALVEAVLQNWAEFLHHKAFHTLQMSSFHGSWFVVDSYTS